MGIVLLRGDYPLNNLTFSYFRVYVKPLGLWEWFLLRVSPTWRSLLFLLDTLVDCCSWWIWTSGVFGCLWMFFKSQNIDSHFLNQWIDGCLADKSSATIRGDSSSSSKAHDGYTGGFVESPIYASYSPSATSQMPLGALKLLDWVLRYRHQIELVKDPATELSGLFPLASSPWAPFRREVSSEASITPHYVLKVGDIVNPLSVWNE